MWYLNQLHLSSIEHSDYKLVFLLQSALKMLNAFKSKGTEEVVPDVNLPKIGVDYNAGLYNLGKPHAYDSELDPWERQNAIA